jgi:hypothetical protein
MRGPTTTHELCEELSRLLGRRVIDETREARTFDVKVTSFSGGEGFFEPLRRSYGLVLTREERPVRIVRIVPAGTRLV